MQNPNNIDISVVIPVYNEENSILPLSERLFQALEGIKKTYEVIFVDDGSSDSTFAKIKELKASNICVSGISFRKNEGKSTALSAGFNKAKGSIIITMDGDLQDSPEEVPLLIQKIEEGYDLVSGWKKQRKDPFEKIFFSKIFNMIISMVSNVKLHDFNCGLKAYRNDAIRDLKLYGSMHRFIPMIVHNMGFKVCEIPVVHLKRLHGKSKFGKDRYLSGFFDIFTVVLITHYLKRPLHFIGKISVFIFLSGLALLLYVAYVKLFLGESGNRPSLIVSMFLLGFATQIFLFGLLAELLSHVNQRNIGSNEIAVRETI